IFNFLLEEMGERIDDLEKHVADLMTEAGIENADEELREPLATNAEIEALPDSSSLSRNHSNQCFNQCRFASNVKLGGEVAVLEDRLEKWANRNLMKFQGKCQASPLGQGKLMLQCSCEGLAGMQLYRKGMGSGGKVEMDTEDQDTMQENPDRSDKPSSSTL
ncbi:PREDICTED: heat shock factor-binding protein 1-like protein 1, partial [Fulmarus glacialis]|uniref:heat shock factor-binding protein 1-like protein 1 n=1 Tax=Fulmarus glacialis TaxID=30455 RepID=UPI00051B1327